MELFYIPNLNPDGAILDGDQFRHAVRVMRRREGDKILVTDGNGTSAEAEILSIGKSEAKLKIESLATFAPSPFVIEVAVAPTKNAKRVEWALEKMTEIGIARFVPVICDRSERPRLNIDRLNGIAVSALKQSQQMYLPRIEESQSFDDFIDQVSISSATKLIGLKHRDSTAISDNYTKGSDVTILIGPEGDFTPHEVERALGAGFKPVLLGKNRLRTETAAVMAVAAIHTLNF